MGAVAARTTPARAHAPAPRSRARGRAADARARTAFRLFVALTVVVTGLGLVRVTLTARVAESSIKAVELRKTIDSQREAAQMLEADKCALTTPSRIEAIASASMRMAEPPEIRYIEVPQGAEEAAAGGEPRSGSQARGGLGGLLSAAMDVAAGGTQVLLVGDVGLTSAE